MGVPGLDEMMGGGLPRGYSLLVAGPSGSGKSILAAAFLVEGARGETGVIAAFEQRSNVARGRVLAELIDADRVGVVDTRAPDLSVEEIAMLLITEIRRLKASRVVIDSLSGFELALAPTFRDDFRESLSRLVSSLASTGAAVLMTSELEDRYTDLRFSPYGTAFHDRRDHRAALHRGRQPLAAGDGRGQGARQRAFQRAAPVPHRWRWHQDRRDGQPTVKESWAGSRAASRKRTPKSLVMTMTELSPVSSSA